MFRKLKLALAAISLLALPVSAAEVKPISAEVSEKVTIQLVHTNDMHGNIAGDGQLLNLSTWYKEFKKQNPNTLLIDAGDALQGTAVVNRTKGKLMQDVMNIVGYDIVTLGNHEFDFGKEALDRNVKNYSATLIQSNIKDAKTKKYPFKRYEIKEFEGVKVGFFGLVGIDTGVKSDPAIMSNFIIEDPVKIGKEMVAFLESQKVDVIVALTHMGVSDEGWDNTKDISERVPGINVIIDAHSHTPCPTKACYNEGTSLISQNEGNFANGARYVTITVEKGRKTFTSTPITAAQLKKFPKDEKAKAIYDAEYKEFAVYGDEVIGETTVEMRAARVTPYDSVRSYESVAANVTVDAYKAAAKTDLAVVNGGNVRITIPAGKITRANILQMHPFSNEVAVMNMTGAQIMEVFEFSVSKFPNENGGFLHLAGGTFKFDSTKPAGSRIVEFLINGQPLDLKKTYTVAIPDFTAKGGDGYSMLAGKPLARTLPRNDAELVMDYIQAQKTIAPKIEGRIVDVARK